MKTRTPILAALTLAMLSSFSSPAGADTIVYKVSLLGGGEILSASAPVPNGSMLLVKNLTDGSLTAVPAELVSNVSKARTSDTALGTKPIKNLVPASRLVTRTDAAGSKSVIVLLAGRKVSVTLATAKMGETLTSANLPATLATGKPSHLSISVSTAKTESGLTLSVGTAKVGQKVSDSLTTAKMAGTLTSADLPATLATGKSGRLSRSVSTAKTESGLTLSVGTAKATVGLEKGLTMKLMTSLDPGQKVFLGPTGGTGTAATRVDTTLVSPQAGASAGFTLSVDPLRASIQDKIFAGDLPRLTPRSGLTAGTLTPTTGEVTIGPNGFPDFTTSTASTGIRTVGPNGFPATATTFSPTGLTRAGGSITPAVTATAAATTGSVTTPATSGARSGVAPAAASPR